MRILIIDDNEYKANHIKVDMERLLKSPDITIQKSRNSGLCTIYDAYKYKKSEPYDLIITDNQLPLYDDEWRTEPEAEGILLELERLNITTPVIICSSEKVEHVEDLIDPKFIVNYDTCVDGAFYFRPLLQELKFIELEGNNDC